ncbi:MAG TPA: GDP-mannose mannosyl hydrolase [Candidatus Eisenbacteria bacterium]|nr:GDP-mannose mannosyl hydrolase [Candidatus Eisenbacteria bacterium]
MELDQASFLQIVRLAPLVSIDIIVRNDKGEVLLGLRKNAPARGMWFVPGGRIYKNERLSDAFARLARSELKITADIRETRFVGVFEHFYDENPAGDPAFGTHYIVLAHSINLGLRESDLPLDQHAKYRWLTEAAILQATDVHPHVKAYVKA